MNTIIAIKNIISKQLSIDVNKITDQTTFKDVEADSLEVVEVIMSIESEFNISIPDDIVENIITVGELAKFVDGLRV